MQSFRTAFHLLFAASLFALPLGGCGDSTGSGGSGASTNGGGDVGGQASGGGDTGGSGGGVGPTCEPPAGTPGTPNDLDVTSVTVVAHDDADDPIDDFELQFCGANLCLYATTSLIGQAVFNNAGGDTLDRPTVKPGDSLTYGKIGYPWDPTAETPFPVYFPAMEDSGQQFAAGSSVSAGGVQLDVGADAYFTIDELTYFEPDQQTFRAASLPVDLVEAATGSPDFAMVFSLGPVDTLFCPGVTATFDNYAGLDAGAAVEIWGQELSLEESFAGYGEWAKIAEGVVSEDGTTITTTGDGLPVLLSVAIKLKG